MICLRNKGSTIVTNVMRLLETTRNANVRKKCIELIPSMYTNIESHFKDGANLKTAITAILNYIRQGNNKDRGQGFISIGKMTGTVDRDVFKRYVDEVMQLIKEEIRPPPVARDGTIKPIANLDSLTCLKQLLKNYAAYLLERKLDML